MAITKPDAQFFLKKVQEFKAQKIALHALIDAAVPLEDGNYRISVNVPEATLELLRALSCLSNSTKR